MTPVTELELVPTTEPAPLTLQSDVVIDKDNEATHNALVSTDQIDRLKRIRALGSELGTDIQEQKKRITRTLEQAVELGTLLSDEKASFIERTGGKGSWEGYFQQYLGNALGYSTGNKYIALATRAVKSLADGEPESNIQRRVMAQLELFPSKEYAKDMSDDKSVPQLTNHLTLVNYFVRWHKPIADGKLVLTAEQKEQLQADFKPLNDFLTSIYE